jgi:putative solute:sodium symporter small subunit
MPHDSAKNMQHRATYWQRARRLTFLLLAIWFAATFGIIFFARELSSFSVFGWPFSFYMAAQGLTLLYVVLIGLYASRMRRLDKQMKNETRNG